MTGCVKRIAERALAWLTESIDRLLARGRMEWARKLHRKSLTRGAIDADSTPGQSGGGKDGGRGKGKGKGKGKGTGRRKARPVSRVIYRTQD